MKEANKIKYALSLQRVTKVVNPLVTSHDCNKSCNKSNISNPKVIQSLLISEAGASEEKYHWLTAVFEQKTAKPRVKH